MQCFWYVLSLLVHSGTLIPFQAFVCLLPVMTFAFFQWTFKDSWFAVLFAVLLFLLVLVGCTHPLVRTFIASRRVDSTELSALPELAYVAPLTFGQFRARRWSFTDLTIVSFFVKALVIVLGPPHGLFQVIFLLCLEVLFLLALCVARPYRSRGGDAMAIFLAIIRLLTVALLIPFAQSLSIKPIPRAALGMGSAVVSSIAVVVLFFSILINAVWGTFRVRMPWRRRGGSESSGSTTARGSDSDVDRESWLAGKPWSPSASTKEHIAGLPPRPGPPELESRFATPARDLGPEPGPHYANAPYSASAMSEFTISDYPHTPTSPSTPRVHSRTTSVSSFGAWNGMTTASAPGTPGAASSNYHSTATHQSGGSRLDAVDEHASEMERVSMSESSRTERDIVHR